VLRIHDPRTSSVEPVRSRRAGQLRILLASAHPGQFTAGDVRAALVADLMMRVAAAGHLHVAAWQHPPAPELRAACAGLNIYPAQFGSDMPSDPDLAVGSPATATGTAAGGLAWIRPAGVVTEDRPSGPPADGAALLRALTARNIDPLALRLELLRQHYRQPARIGWAGLEASDQRLRAWRAQVAQWARSPGKPMCAAYTGAVTEAFSDDLNSPAALGALEALAGDAGIPAGSKFEAFAHLDRLFGLDLAREVGR
jgi:hypothetical protein